MMSISDYSNLMVADLKKKDEEEKKK